MGCLNVFRMVVSPRASHSFRVPVVRYDVAAVRKFLVADCTFSVLLDDLSVEKFPHLGGRSQFPVSSGVMRIFDSLNAEP